MPAGIQKRSGEIVFLTKTSKFHQWNLNSSWANRVKGRISFQISSDGDGNTESVTFPCALNSHLAERHKLIQARVGDPFSSRFLSTMHMTLHTFFARVDFSSLSECITFRGSKDFDLWLLVCKQAKEKKGRGN